MNATRRARRALAAGALAAFAYGAVSAAPGAMVSAEARPSVAQSSSVASPVGSVRDQANPPLPAVTASVLPTAESSVSPAASPNASPIETANPLESPTPSPIPSISPTAKPFVTPAPSRGGAPVVVPAIGGSPWSAVRIAALRHDLDAMLTKAPALRGAHVGVLVVDTKTGAQLYGRRADDAFQPASTLKLLVGSAALEKLGPDFHFTTVGYVERVPGVAWLEAGGDPFLEGSDLAAFADAVARTKVKRVILLVGAGRYDDLPHAPGWTWDDFAYDYAPPISAMVVNENVVEIEVRPGAKERDPARAFLVPIAGRPGRLIQPEFVSSVAVTLPAGRPTMLDVTLGAEGLVVVGGIAAGAPAEHLDAAIPDARQFAFTLTETLLREVDVAVDAPAPGFVFATSSHPVWSHDSPPLHEFLGQRFWIPSDNLVAELLLKELGYQTGGGPGTWDKGIAFEKTWLQSIGIDPATTTLADGSGMSQYDRISPRDLVTILQHDWNGPNRELVLGSLPIGGSRGTIEGIAGTPAAGRVFAKTGSMMHVRGLAGYLATEHHGAVTFAFSVDDWLGDYPALAALRARVLSRIVQD